jgi:hypothetical protein
VERVEVFDQKSGTELKKILDFSASEEKIDENDKKNILNISVKNWNPPLIGEKRYSVKRSKEVEVLKERIFISSEEFSTLDFFKPGEIKKRLIFFIVKQDVFPLK